MNSLIECDDPELYARLRNHFTIYKLAVAYSTQATSEIAENLQFWKEKYFEWGAIEIKKIETNNASLALNSSYPKQALKSDSTMISSACRNAEAWDKKDIVYCVGVVQNNSLKHLAMVYGYDYCAAEECYSKVKTTIKNGVESIPNVEFADTNELGRVNKVDPLGITYLRVRGMWGIENPWTVFNYIYNRNYSNKFNFMCVINSDKWNSLDNRNALIDMEKSKECLKISDVKIKNPDNPAQLRDAKLITFYIK